MLKQYLPADVPAKKEKEFLKNFKKSAGRSGILCEGGNKIDEKEFLEELYEQIHTGKSRGNATGRNIHQREFKEAVKMANAIYALTVENKNVKEALKILKDQ